MTNIIRPLDSIINTNMPSIFLAGTIDNGDSLDWQKEVENYFSGDNVSVINPRRDSWDATWKQSIDEPVFKQQVEWELKHLALADIVLMYFAPNSQSPITLLEFGLMADKNKLVVCCPPGFWRKGNIDVTCQQFSIPLFEGLDDALVTCRQKLTPS